MDRRKTRWRPASLNHLSRRDAPPRQPHRGVQIRIARLSRISRCPVVPRADASWAVLAAAQVPPFPWPLQGGVLPPGSSRAGSGRIPGEAGGSYRRLRRDDLSRTPWRAIRTCTLPATAEQRLRELGARYLPSGPDGRSSAARQLRGQLPPASRDPPFREDVRAYENVFAFRADLPAATATVAAPPPRSAHGH